MTTPITVTEINGATATGCETWNACLGEAAWLRFPLEHNLKYASPLPVQQTVIPTVARALLSGIPMDVSLTAPTGSGKTLCYLLPALRLITCEKRGVDRTALRAVILVPTKALGQQVFREVQRLIRNTSITATSLCDDVETIKSESWELMRYATTVMRSGDATTVQPQQQSEWGNAVAEDPSAEDGNDQSVYSGEGTQYGTVAFSKVDLLVATPQRLLRHLDGATPGFSLAALRLLIIDEADQVLAGSFASFVSKVVDRFEAEQAQRQAAEVDALRCASAASSSSSTSTSPIAARLLASTTTTGVLHTILCSATLSSRVGRVSEVRLRNCVHYMLDSHGQDVAEGGNGEERALTASHNRGFLKTTFALPPTLQEHIVFVTDAYRHAALLKLVMQLVASIQKRHAARDTQRAKKQLALEKESSDTDDEDRDAAATSAADASSSPHTTTTGSSSSSSNDYPAADDDSGTGILVFCSSAEEARVVGHLLTAAGVAGVVEFTTLATESERRRALLGPLRSDSGKASGLGESDGAEVGLPTETRRGRKASSSFSPMCVVASDALMRGIDIPNIGHVIMYHPPTSISQYVHRAGRTARAMRSGHLHLLLSKTGRGGTQQDGEMALFKVLSEQLTRTLPVRHERHFFFFDKAPPKKEKVTETPKEAQATVAAAPTATPAEAEAETKAEPAPSHSAPLPVPTEAPTEDAAAGPSPAEVAPVRAGSGEWWVETADRYLQQSQHHLQRMWASALETALREAKATRTAEAASVTNTEAHAKANEASPVAVKVGQSAGRPQRGHTPHGTPSKASRGAPHAKRAPSKRGAGQKRGRE